MQAKFNKRGANEKALKRQTVQFYTQQTIPLVKYMSKSSVSLWAECKSEKQLCITGLNQAHKPSKS